MSIESELATEIKNIPAVQELVSDRIYPVAAPQTSDKPFVTYRRVPGDVLYTQEGESSIQKAFFQIAAVAEKYEDVGTLADALRSGLSGKRIFGGPIFLKGPEDSWNQETGLFVRTQDCTITYRK